MELTDKFKYNLYIDSTVAGLDLIWCFNATFTNISAISWRPVFVLEEAGVPGKKHRP
jgi:hypothetical protein